MVPSPAGARSTTSHHGHGIFVSGQIDASSVLGIRLDGTERSQEPIEFGVVSPLEPDGEVRSLSGRQQLEVQLCQATCRRQVNGAEAGKPTTQQVIK